MCGDFLYILILIAMANFIPAAGRIETARIATKASTQYDIGDPLYNNGTNEIPAVSTTDKVSYVAAETKSSGDATTDSILVWKTNNTLFRATVTTGTLTKVMEGKLMDLTDQDGVDASATTEKVVRCENFISASEGFFSFDTGKNT